MTDAAGGASASGAGGSILVTSSGGILTVTSGGAAGVSGAGGVGGAGGGNGGSAGSMEAGAPRRCGPNGFVESVYTVPLPAEGVPAQPGQICSATVEPVDSNRAARVTLVADPVDPLLASGFVQIDASLLSGVVGLPTVEVVDATAPDFKLMQVSAMTQQPGGFAFQARWPQLRATPGFARMTVRTTLEVACDTPGLTRIVHAAMDIHFCNKDYRSGEWVSAGDQCTVCSIIAEMAPSPIVPDKRADGLPLARVLRLRIVELARVSNAVVLLAENDGGEGMEYEWQASVGRLEKLAPDVALWTLEEGMPAPFLQVAVFGADGAAVASWGFNEAA